MNELQQAELQEWEEQPAEERQHFEITGLDSLNWAFRKLSAFKAKEAEITELAKKERERIDFWEAEQKKSIQGDMEFFENLIQRYHAQRLAENPKAKTLSTPFGKSKSRTSKPAPEKQDENKLLKYVTDNGLDEFIKKSVKWGDLKKNLKVTDIDGKAVVVDTTTGMYVPGVTIKPAQTTFNVEVTE
ncbi:host-nuclease inhibitor Gam family protein [Heyndrickxia coagulans]|uniref:Uncharacterized protein n=1 Tax=Heyndrickxia coagulans TaxID=1398 RepID=A0A150K550_HEYCO|nr:host-nuclease inhibitor Gam family protein [Heyndrickxia coagulans]KYC64717.1 hypothetical protein B4098_3410 [Heyndrickxia coagulans]